MKKAIFQVLTLAGLLFSGCATDYKFRSSVPEEMRTVSVPTFRNDSTLTEIGPLVPRQILREFQREGTFGIRAEDDAALEIQGEVLSAAYDSIAYNRRGGLRGTGGFLNLKAKVSVVDKKAGRVLIDGKVYSAQAPIATSQDLDTAKRNASGRVADVLAQQVVDDVLNVKW